VPHFGRLKLLISLISFSYSQVQRGKPSGNLAFNCSKAPPE
jgi:hypothetical protein